MKLKSCPFCGTDKEEYVTVENIGPRFGSKCYAVYCDNCGATGPIETISTNYKIELKGRIEEAKAHAIEDWNARV